MQTLWQDLRYGARMLVKQPGFTLIAVVTLALGIGATTAIFSVVNGVLLRPLAFTEPQQLVRLWETNQDKGGAHEMTSLSNLRDWQSRNQSFAGIAAWQRLSSLTLTGQTPAVELTASLVTTDFFALLGVQPVLGRTFTAAESQPGHTRVAVLSHALWQQLGAPAQLTTIQLEKTEFQLIGVLPPEFQSPAGAADLWLPMRFTPNEIDRGQTYLSALARLQPGVTQTQAQSELDGIAAQLAREYPASNRGRGLVLVSLLDETVGHVRPALWLVFVAVALLLLLACANTANLLLVRAAGRRRELAVRQALGAARGRIVRQLVTESLLLFAAGGAGGLLVANGSLKLLRVLSPVNLPRMNEVVMDATALLFAAGAALVTGLVFGLAPAFFSSVTDLNLALKAGQRNATRGRGEQRLQQGLVVSQLALACVLLTGAGLLVRSYARLGAVPPGFEPHNLLVVRAQLDNEYREQRREVAYFRTLTERLRALPGVREAGAATVLPLNPVGIDFDVPWQSGGATDPSRANAPKARFRAATPDYLQTIGAPLLRGRSFSELDDNNAPRVVIINQTLAAQAWPGENPIGKPLRFHWADWQSYEVVGVVGDMKSYGLAAPTRAELFVPHAQIPYTVMNVVVRTTQDAAQVAPDVRRVMLELDAAQPPNSIVTMNELFAAALARERFARTLLEILAGLALALAAVGVYGVLAFAVTQRTPEIGLRVALGAGRADVLRLFLAQALKLSLLGVAIALLVSLALARLAQGLLFGIRATDPLTLVAAVLLTVLVALLGCWLPARRALKVDPLVALRTE